MNNDKKEKKQPEENQDELLKPAPGTTHTTDPQKKMEGPISSLVKSAGETFTTDKTKEEAEEEKEKNM